MIFVVAYNARETLWELLDRIPSLVGVEYEVLVIDDSSVDATYEVGLAYQRGGRLPLKVFKTPFNQGYGGNQKLGYRYAVDHGFDFVALLHGDGQYPPERLPELLEPLLTGRADAVFGSRMMKPGNALRGGMPLYKYVGNRILTMVQNLLLSSRLSEYHSGYRAYSVRALARIPFEHNTNHFHFDTEIIIQLMTAGFCIEEIPIPTYYGDEICYVNGVRYAKDVFLTTLVSSLQRFGLVFRRKYAISCGESPYTLKLGYMSSHSMAIDAVERECKVLDIGCGAGYLGSELEDRKGCHVTGIDQVNPEQTWARERLSCYRYHDLSKGTLPAELDTDYEVLLMLDIIEHLQRPERLLDEVRRRFGSARPRVILTTANVGFLVVRLGLLFGQFNYGPRGVLDLTHTRLFTFRSLLMLLDEAGYEVTRVKGIPAPFPLALGDGFLSRFVLRINAVLIKLLPGLFSYQIYVEAQIKPTVKQLLRVTMKPDSQVALWAAGEGNVS